MRNDANLEELAAETPGFSGADLKNLVNEAALLGARRGQNEVHFKDFMDALEKIVLGPERPLLLSRADKERIAYHEGGHAIMGLVVPGADPVNRVTIVPRGQALGVTYQRPDADRYNYPEAYLRARIIGMLGGRAAEEVVYGTKTTGAESDIEQATGLARRMVTRWGMSERLGLVQLAPRENPYLSSVGGYGSVKPFSEETAETIDAEVFRIISESHEEAKKLLSKYRKQLDALAEALVARETLDEKEILEATGPSPRTGPGDRETACFIGGWAAVYSAQIKGGASFDAPPSAFRSKLKKRKLLLQGNGFNRHVFHRPVLERTPGAGFDFGHGINHIHPLRYFAEDRVTEVVLAGEIQEIIVRKIDEKTGKWRSR